MDAGAVIALASVIVVVEIAVFGGIIRYLVNKIDRHDTEHKTDLLAVETKYEAKLQLADKTLDAKQETIDELRRQLDKLEITAKLQDRFFDQLPKQLPPSGAT